MLGEQHDHPDHHLLELFFLDYLGRTGRLGAVALEIPRDDLISAAAEQAVTAVPIDLGEPARTKVRSSEREIAHFSEAHTNYLSQLIVDSHCGMFGLDQAKPFVDVQIARDQHMAIRLLELTEPAAVNLFIGGAGHVRNDYGIPLWLAKFRVNPRPIGRGYKREPRSGSNQALSDFAPFHTLFPCFARCRACTAGQIIERDQSAALIFALAEGYVCIGVCVSGVMRTDFRFVHHDPLIASFGG